MGPPGHDACDPVPSMASGCLAQAHIPQGPGTLNLRPAVATVMMGLESPAKSRWNPSPFFSSDHTRDSPTPTHHGVHPRRGGVAPGPGDPEGSALFPTSLLPPEVVPPRAVFPPLSGTHVLQPTVQSWPAPPETCPDKSTHRAWRQRCSDCTWAQSSGQWEGEGGLATLCAQQRDSGTTRESMIRSQKRLQWH